MDSLINHRAEECLKLLSHYNSSKHGNLIKVLSKDISLLNHENYSMGIYIYLYALNLYNIQFCYDEKLSEILRSFFYKIQYNLVEIEKLLLDKLKIYFFNNDYKYNIKEYNTILNYETLINTLRKTKSKLEHTNLNIISSDLKIKGNHLNNFIPAVSNDGGFILSSIDEYSLEFVKYAISAQSMIANIGSGYGIIERYALLLGAKCNIICNDVCQDHLDIIRELSYEKLTNQLTFKSGYFPNEVSIDDNSLELLGIFRVLHFMNPKNLRKSLLTSNLKLKLGGHLIISAETPYLSNWKAFITVYENNIKESIEFPGYISDTQRYESQGFKNKLPKEMHFLDENILRRELSAHGFEIIKCSMFSRDDDFPKEILLDGRESVGVVARKIKCMQQLI